MDRTLTFRRNLAARLIGASTLALPAAAWIACSPNFGAPGPLTQCYAPLEITDSDAGEFDGGASCPSMDQVNAHFGIGGPNTGCGRALSEPTFDAGVCCYLTQECGGGRPYLDGGQARRVTWAVAHGGSDVRDAVARAFAAPVTLATSSRQVPCEMVAHGRPDPSDLRAVLDRTLHEVIGPCGYQSRRLVAWARRLDREDRGLRRSGRSAGRAPVQGQHRGQRRACPPRSS
jgi:hypothetical protein